MKISRSKKFPLGFHASRMRGVTLVEMMVTIMVFSMVVMGLIAVHLFGLRYDGVVGSKLGASDQSRMALGHLINEIRAAKGYQIGSYSGSTFTANGDGTAQSGNALKIFTKSDQTAYITYYLVNATDGGELRRTQTGFTGYDLTAQWLTNTSTFGTNIPLFVSEDYSGAVQSTGYNGTSSTANTRWIIHITLQFFQYKYPKTTVGPGKFYDYYKMEFKAAPRATL